ncbi:MAG: hypothetical protein V1688_00995 [bacterium]
MDLINESKEYALLEIEKSEDERFEYLSNALRQEIIKQFRGKKLPSAKKQLD